MVEKAHTSGFPPSMYDPFRSLSTRVADWFAPAAEASAGEGAYAIRMELPGIAEEDIHLTVEDGVATVKGEKKSDREEKGETWYFSEREYGSFSRSFRLPPDADAQGVKADLKDGVLAITIPKKVPSTPAGGARIPINKG